MSFRDRMLGGVSHAPLYAAAGEGGAGAAEEVADGIVVDNGPDDGFTPEERAQFAEMQQREPTPAPAPAPAPAEEEAPAVVEGAAPAEGGDDDDDEPDEAVVADGAAPKPSRRVSRAKYDKEMAARDKEITDLRKANADNAVMQAKLDERMRIINEALTPKQQQEREEDDPEPDPEQDIFAHNQWLRRQLGNTQKAVNELRGGLQQRDQQTGVERTYMSDAARFAQQEPHFPEAYNYLMASRVAELAIYRFGKDLSEEGVSLTQPELRTISQIVEGEENQLVQAALEGGRSPAQQLFMLARSRGYRPQAAEAKPNGAANGAANGASAPVAANGKPSVKEEIARMKKGVESSVSLSNAGGAPAVALTPEKLANMDQEEFNALMDSLDEKDQQRMMGGR